MKLSEGGMERQSRFQKTSITSLLERQGDDYEVNFYNTRIN